MEDGSKINIFNNPSLKGIKSRPLEAITSLILFAVLFIIDLLLSLISVDAQGMHFTIDNIGIKSAMTAVFAVLGVSMSFTMRINARARFDDLNDTKGLKIELDKYNKIDRITAQKYLNNLQLKEYKEHKENALKRIYDYVKDYIPQPTYHYNRKYSKDINKVIKAFYLINPKKDTIDGLLNPLQVEFVQNDYIYALPESRSERDKKWLLKKGISKFLKMFFVIGLAGEITSTIIMTGEIMSTIIRILVTVFTCAYAYTTEFKTCNCVDKTRLNKSIDILKKIEHLMQTQPLDEESRPKVTQPTDEINPEISLSPAD